MTSYIVSKLSLIDIYYVLVGYDVVGAILTPIVVK
jgi:hypothetical protein